MARSHLESQHQRAFFQWARMHPVARRFFAIPNGGKRSAITAAILKAEGVRAGVLDTFLPYPAGGKHGLWIEFKAGKNTLSAEQRDFAVDAMANGYAVGVAYSCMAGIDLALRYLSADPAFSEMVVAR